jgi:hypothetical protein
MQETQEQQQSEGFFHAGLIEINTAKVLNLRENTIGIEFVMKVILKRQFSFVNPVQKKSKSLLKPKFFFMKDLYYNDTAYIAQSFYLSDDYTAQNARLASFKVNSYKLSRVKSSFFISRDELLNNLKDSLLNYTSPDIILADLGFFQSEFEN